MVHTHSLRWHAGTMHHVHSTVPIPTHISRCSQMEVSLCSSQKQGIGEEALCKAEHDEGFISSFTSGHQESSSKTGCSSRTIVPASHSARLPWEGNTHPPRSCGPRQHSPSQSSTVSGNQAPSFETSQSQLTMSRSRWCSLSSTVFQWENRTTEE